MRVTSAFEFMIFFARIGTSSIDRNEGIRHKQAGNISVEIIIIDQKIPKEEALRFLGLPFEDMVKFVVDVRRGIMAFGGSMHADAEAVLLRDGSKQSDLWGGNFFPKNPAESQIELHSLINIRPADKNRSLVVQDEALAQSIKSVTSRLLGLPW